MGVVISVAICTYNRADLLRGAVESLCRQTLQPDYFEIIIVDNASSDDARQVIEDLRVKFPGNKIEYIKEPRLGVGYARNTAYRAAHSVYVGYIDDDASAEPDWLEKALDLFNGASHPPVCVGGPILPFYSSAKPPWFLDDYETRSWGSQIRVLCLGEAFSGSNMIWRRDVLEAIGGFGESLGPKGDRLGIGEDTAAFKRIWQNDPGCTLIYSPELRIGHWVPAYKMRVSYSFKRAFVTGQSEVKLLGPQSFARRIRIFIGSLYHVCVRILRALFHIRRYPLWQNWAVEEGRLILDKLGSACAALGMYIKVNQE